MNKATLFVDESGKASLADQLNRLFILTGVILDNSEIQTIEGFFNYIKLKFKLPQTQTFHSYDIFENPKTKLSDTALVNLSKNISEFISLIPVKFHIAWVIKNQFRSALGVKSFNDFKGSPERKEMKDYPYRVAATYIFAKFGEHLERSGAIGQIIADSRKGGDHQLLKTLDLCKEKAVSVKDKYHEAIKNKISAICFAEKGFLSGGLEVADIASYITFNRAMRKMSVAKVTGVDKIWEQIKPKAKIAEINQDSVRRYFKLKPGEVHKCLKQKIKIFVNPT